MSKLNYLAIGIALIITTFPIFSRKETRPPMDELCLIRAQERVKLIKTAAKIGILGFSVYHIYYTNRATLSYSGRKDSSSGILIGLCVMSWLAVKQTQILLDTASKYFNFKLPNLPKFGINKETKR